MKAALLRLLRVIVAQAITWAVAEFGNVSLPYFSLVTIGAVINAVAKFLRDKFKWDWLPV